MTLFIAITLILVAVVIFYKPGLGFKNWDARYFIKIVGAVCLLMGMMALLSYFKNLQ